MQNTCGINMKTLGLNIVLNFVFTFSSHIQVDNTTFDDIGEYTIEIEGRSKTAKLTVTPKSKLIAPFFVEKPKKIDVDEGWCDWI